MTYRSNVVYCIINSTNCFSLSLSQISYRRWSVVATLLSTNNLFYLSLFKDYKTKRVTTKPTYDLGIDM